MSADLNSFAWLLDRLAHEPRRNARLALITAYFRQTADPERGFALAAMTGQLAFANARAGLIRSLIMERSDPVLFALSYDYVGDLSETVALMWPAPALSCPGHDKTERREGAPPLDPNRQAPALSEIVATLASADKRALPALVADWLDALDETGRWALLKLITGSLRIGVSARLAKTAVAALGALEPDDVEQVWHGLEAPYLSLFAWAEGHGPRPEATDPAPFRPAMLAHPLEDDDFDRLEPSAFTAEWKWDGVRIQAASGLDGAGRRVTRLYSRTGEEMSGSFPDLAEAVTFDGAIDGELLILREGRVQSFNVLQQRLNRKAVSARLLAEFPAHIRAYDLLFDGDEDVRPLPLAERRRRLEAFIARHGNGRMDLSVQMSFESWEDLAAGRADPARLGAGADADAIEGLMLKRRDSSYLPGRPKGLWYKWKRDPALLDCVLMYAQRGHGKRSSFYSDFTFGCWRAGPNGDELTPVGKAYFGFTDEELAQLDRFVRKNTINRFGPVREVTHEPGAGLVLEIAFEGIQRSTRHKSGVAMRFPRINRIRWDKPPREADRMDTIEAMLQRIEARAGQAAQ
ncbi:MAG: cisplatin damage response ATP-dependent DNA ligase [Bosea sp.]|jgi:DNA ligase-1|nr:cisplatin damage response ATP-dependent DNA ligase [Bosea sp. (in: a-proteobacteria)]